MFFCRTMSCRTTSAFWLCVICIVATSPSLLFAQDDGTCERLIGRPQATPMVIQFDADSHELRPLERQRIQGLGERVRGDPSGKVCVLGHPDILGDADYNSKLARLRAEAVAKEIENAGVDRENLIVEVPDTAFSGLSVFESISALDSDRRVEVILMGRETDP